MVTNETESTVRVYVVEWVFDRRFATLPEASAYAEATYAGRLLEGDLRVLLDEVDTHTWVVWVRRPNVNSEWKRPELATAWAAALMEDGQAAGDDIRIVTRNSREEHKLLQYGVLKLV